ncbi:hypothetical protein [Timonella sp. A28]|uniref:hypothetical protein n=1 Tax=Timonella sp. A28 TaxID=3442640 RepID=UPI003EB8997B
MGTFREYVQKNPAPPHLVTHHKQKAQHTMTIPQEAIEAAAQAIFKEAQGPDQDNSWEELRDNSWKENWRKLARNVLEAALPHIREHIAQEITDSLKDYEAHCREDVTWYDGHMNAARIARGETQ